MKPIRRAFGIASFFLLAWGSCTVAQSQYSIIPIVPPAGSGAYSIAGLGMNDLGEIVGSYSRYADPQGRNQIRSFHYSDSTGTREAWPDVWTSSAEGINNRGQIALYGGESHRTAQAYRYTAGVGYEPLGNLGGQITETDAINAYGQITGFSEGADGREHAYRYTDGVGMQNLGAVFMIGSRGFAINDQGWVAGYGDGNGFLYRDDQGLVDLGPGIAYGINNEGTVVGRAFTPVGTSEAFIYQDGQLTLLGQLGGGVAALADINNYGVGAGYGNVIINNGVAQHALLWNSTDGLVDLNSLLPEDSGWTLISATAINDLGQITGQGIFNGMALAYRLDPIPEPSTWMLLGLGATMASALWRRTRP